MCPMEKICVLDKPHSGMSYSAVNCEFNVNDQQCILNKSLNRHTHKTRLYIDQTVQCWD